MTRPPWRSRATAVAVAATACWLAAVVVPPLALLDWRDRRLAEVAGPEAQANWDAFRADMRRQAGREGPVQRKVPKSAEPPELVWLRDHLRLAIVAWVTLAGVLGGFLTAIAVGLARAADAAALATQEGTAGGGNHQEQHERDA
ncbi:MAG: hypothetical protein ACKO4T_13300 [Planctomycetaceae bacterium]